MTRAVASAMVGLAAFVAVAGPAVAGPLPAQPRALPLQDSADRDSPVVEMGYGPRASAVLGGELGIWQWRRSRWTWAISGQAHVGLDNATVKAGLPLELLRGGFGLSAIATWRPRLQPHQTWEFSACLCRHLTRNIGDYDPLPLTRPDGIPFGGAGGFLGVHAGLRWQNAGHSWTFKLGQRVYPSALLAWSGEPELASFLSSWGGEALRSGSSADVQWRWQGASRWQPQAALHGAWWLPTDASASASGYARLMAGPAYTATQGRLWPFVAVDMGSGPGLLINRHELRLAVGLRYAPD
jgi:hypothetical protein